MIAPLNLAPKLHDRAIFRRTRIRPVLVQTFSFKHWFSRGCPESPGTSRPSVRPTVLQGLQTRN